MSQLVELTSIPDDLSPVNAGATPLWIGMQTTEPYFKKNIYNVLVNEMKNSVFTRHEPGIWECFDRAFWGISVVRCKCPGAPVGIAYGNALEGPVSALPDPRHAVIYYWHWMNNTYTLAKFDPQIGNVDNFDLKAFVGFPICRPNYNIGGKSIGKCELLPPFDSTIGEGQILIYNNFEDDPGYDVTKFGKIMSDLGAGSYSLCARPATSKEGDIYTKKRFREDRAFWVFNQLRSKYNRAAVGFAWGTKTREPDALSKDTAVVVVWSSPEDYIYWDIVGKGKINKEDFKAKFIVG
jgi:hypothetical protein